MIRAIVLLALLVVVHVLAMAAAGALLGVPPREVRIGFGPPLLRVRRVVVGVIPLGGSVSFSEGGDDPFAGRVAWKLAPIALAGCGALVLLGLALGASLGSLASGWPQLVLGAMHPHDVGAPLVARAFAGLRTAPLDTAGVLAMKSAAMNLLPLPSLNGGNLVRAVMAVVGPTARPPGALRALALLPLLALMVGWSIALFSA